MKMLTTSLLALALFAVAGNPLQAAPRGAEQGVSAHYTQSGDVVHKRRYYYRPYYRPYYSYRPYYRERVYRPNFYYNGPGLYFETGRPYWYPRGYY